MYFVLKPVAKNLLLGNEKNRRQIPLQVCMTTLTFIRKLLKLRSLLKCVAKLNVKTIKHPNLY